MSNKTASRESKGQIPCRRIATSPRLQNKIEGKVEGVGGRVVRVVESSKDVGGKPAGGRVIVVVMGMKPQGI